MRSDEALKLARRSADGWGIETVDDEGTVGQRSSLEFRSDGEPTISYFGNRTLRFAWRQAGTRTVLTVDSGGTVGNYTSLALDHNDDAAISYFDVSNADLKFAHLKATARDGDIGD